MNFQMDGLIIAQHIVFFSAHINVLIRKWDPIDNGGGAERTHGLVPGVRGGRPDVRSLMSRRDAALRARAAGGKGTLDDTRLEVLSQRWLNIDRRIATILGN